MKLRGRKFLLFLVVFSSIYILSSKVVFAGRGCCSWHDGVCGCSNGRQLCCDGTLSPSCTCYSSRTNEPVVPVATRVPPTLRPEPTSTKIPTRTPTSKPTFIQTISPTLYQEVKGQKVETTSLVVSPDEQRKNEDSGLLGLGMSAVMLGGFAWVSKKIWTKIKGKN